MTGATLGQTPVWTDHNPTKATPCVVREFAGMFGEGMPVLAYGRFALRGVRYRVEAADGRHRIYRED